MTTPDPNQPTESNDIRQLREANDRKDARIKDLEGQLTAFRDAALEGLAHRSGFNPGHGVTKLVLEKLAAQENLTVDQLQPEKFVEFAKGLGVTPEMAPLTPPTSSAPDASQQQQPQVPGQQAPAPGQPAQPGQPAGQDFSQQMAQFQQGADGLAAAALPQPITDDPAQQIAKAESEGRWSDSLALKVQQATATPLPPGFGQQAGVHTPS